MADLNPGHVDSYVTHDREDALFVFLQKAWAVIIVDEKGLQTCCFQDNLVRSTNEHGKNPWGVYRKESQKCGRHQSDDG